jgi:hypothetical protein
VDALEPGEIAAPIDVLEGVAIFRLEDRKRAAVRPFESVRGRALELLTREQAGRAWSDFVAGLRLRAVIRSDPTLFPGTAHPAAGRQEQPWPAAGNSRGD